MTGTVRRRGPFELWRYSCGGGRLIIGAVLEVSW